MKKLALTIAAAAMVAFAGSVMADPGLENPTADNDNPSNCLGAERATRNSNTGNRAQGVFGEEQSPVVRANQPYGQIVLLPHFETCIFPPGG